jgi:hypothetical protein
VIEPRVYRAAFVPALLALVLAMFSLESRPKPLPQGLAADVLFDGRLAGASAAQLARRHPDRRAGSPGDRATAAEVASAFEGRGFRVERDAFTSAGKDLVNVVGRRAGRSRRQLAIVAARDAKGVPDATGSAADTAAMLELARVFQGRASRKTLVLASVDGSELGEVGTARLADELGDPSQLDAVMVISNLGARHRRGSVIVPWSNDTTRAGIGLQRTLAASLREEIDVEAGGTSAAGQLARLAFPIGIGPQGVLLEKGFEAVRVSGSGELPPDGSEGPQDIDEDRLGGLGRGTLRTMTALDQGGRPDPGPGTYVTAVSQVMPGWVLSLLAITLLLPALVAAVDAFARARRRREPVGRWLRWLGAWISPFVAGYAIVELLALAGITPDPPPAPVAPGVYPLDGAAIAVLGCMSALVALLWWGGRFLAIRADPALRDPSAPGAAVAVTLVVSCTVLVLWAVNPFAALVMVPAVHLWLLATGVDPAPTRRGRALLVSAGVLPPVLVAIYYLLALRMDPLSGAWYLLLLVTGGDAGLLFSLIGCVLLGALGGIVAIARAGREEPGGPPEERPRVYGPGAYAGPGSLGGTESALRR